MALRKPTPLKPRTAITELDGDLQGIVCTISNDTNNSLMSETIPCGTIVAVDTTMNDCIPITFGTVGLVEELPYVAAILNTEYNPTSPVPVSCSVMKLGTVYKFDDSYTKDITDIIIGCAPIVRVKQDIDEDMPADDMSAYSHCFVYCPCTNVKKKLTSCRFPKVHVWPANDDTAHFWQNGHMWATGRPYIDPPDPEMWWLPDKYQAHEYYFVEHAGYTYATLRRIYYSHCVYNPPGSGGDTGSGGGGDGGGTGSGNATPPPPPPTSKGPSTEAANDVFNLDRYVEQYGPTIVLGYAIAGMQCAVFTRHQTDNTEWFTLYNMPDKTEDGVGQPVFHNEIKEFGYCLGCDDFIFVAYHRNYDKYTAVSEGEDTDDDGVIDTYTELPQEKNWVIWEIYVGGELKYNRRLRDERDFWGDDLLRAEDCQVVLDSLQTTRGTLIAPSLLRWQPLIKQDTGTTTAEGTITISWEYEPPSNIGLLQYRIVRPGYPDGSRIPAYDAKTGAPILSWTYTNLDPESPYPYELYAVLAPCQTAPFDYIQLSDSVSTLSYGSMWIPLGNISPPEGALFYRCKYRPWSQEADQPWQYKNNIPLDANEAGDPGFWLNGLESYIQYQIVLEAAYPGYTVIEAFMWDTLGWNQNANDDYDNRTHISNSISYFIEAYTEVVRDDDGNPVPELDEEGNLQLDDNGEIIYQSKTSAGFSGVFTNCVTSVLLYSENTITPSILFHQGRVLYNWFDTEDLTRILCLDEDVGAGIHCTCTQCDRIPQMNWVFVDATYFDPSDPYLIPITGRDWINDAYPDPLTCGGIPSDNVTLMQDTLYWNECCGCYRVETVSEPGNTDQRTVTTFYQGTPLISWEYNSQVGMNWYYTCINSIVLYVLHLDTPNGVYSIYYYERGALIGSADIIDACGSFQYGTIDITYLGGAVRVGVAPRTDICAFCQRPVSSAIQFIIFNYSVIVNNSIDTMPNGCVMGAQIYNTHGVSEWANASNVWSPIPESATSMHVDMWLITAGVLIETHSYDLASYSMGAASCGSLPLRFWDILEHHEGYYIGDTSVGDYTMISDMQSVICYNAKPVLRAHLQLLTNDPTGGWTLFNGSILSLNSCCNEYGYFTLWTYNNSLNDIPPVNILYQVYNGSSLVAQSPRPILMSCDLCGIGIVQYQTQNEDGTWTQHTDTAANGKLIGDETVSTACCIITMDSKWKTLDNGVCTRSNYLRVVNQHEWRTPEIKEYIVIVNLITESYSFDPLDGGNTTYTTTELGRKIVDKDTFNTTVHMLPEKPDDSPVSGSGSYTKYYYEVQVQTHLIRNWDGGMDSYLSAADIEWTVQGEQDWTDYVWFSITWAEPEIQSEKLVAYMTAQDTGSTITDYCYQQFTEHHTAELASAYEQLCCPFFFFARNGSSATVISPRFGVFFDDLNYEMPE